MATMIRYKIIFVGNEESGKSSFIQRFLYDSFDSDYRPSIGVDFISKTFTSEEYGSVRLQIWDTAGHQRFKPLFPSHYKDCQGVGVAYDSTNNESFNAVIEWINEIRQHTDIPIVIVGMKSDLDVKRGVSLENAQAYAAENMFKHVECSSKDNINIKEVISTLVSEMIQWSLIHPIEATKSRSENLLIKDSCISEEQNILKTPPYIQQESHNGKSNICLIL